MKKFWIGLTWFGLGLVIIGSFLALPYTIKQLMIPDPIIEWGGPYSQYQTVGSLLAIGLLMTLFGSLLTLIGGVIARPYYLWMAFIIAGIICFTGLSGVFINFIKIRINFPGTVFIESFILACIPGSICVIEGVILRKNLRKSEFVTNN